MSTSAGLFLWKLSVNSQSLTIRKSPRKDESREQGAAWEIHPVMKLNMAVIEIRPHRWGWLDGQLF